MGLKAGALLWNRLQVEFPPNAVSVDVDTGLTQHNRSFDDYSLGEPTLDTPSRVQVAPLSPIANWATIEHGEPFLDPVTNTIHVVFTSAAVAPEPPFQLPALNVLFWDPHSVVGPGDADPYESVILYAAANQLSKPVEGPIPPGGNINNAPPGGPNGFLINPVFGTPDGIAVIVIDPENGTGEVIQQSQPEGLMPIVPFRNAVGGALVYDAESHHFNVSKDRTRLIAFGLDNNFIYVFDISGAKRLHPELITSASLDPTEYNGPHDAYEMADGTFLVTMSGNLTAVPMGTGPGGIIQIDRDGNFLMQVMDPSHAMFTSAAISIAINENGVMAYPTFQPHHYYHTLPPGGNPNQVGHEVVFFDYDVDNPGTIVAALQTATLQDGAYGGFFSTSPTWIPGSLNGQEVLLAMTVSAGVFALRRPTGSNGPFAVQMIYPLPVGGGYPQHAAMHTILMTVGDTNELLYNKLYLTDTWGNTIHVLDLSNGLPPPGQFFSTAPGATYAAKTIANPNVHWAAFTPSGKHFYTSNMLYASFDFFLGKFPPVTNYEIRQYDVSDTGTLTPTPTLTVPAPTGYGFVKFKLYNSAASPGTHE